MPVRIRKYVKIGRVFPASPSAKIPTPEELRKQGKRMINLADYLEEIRMAQRRTTR